MPTQYSSSKVREDLLKAAGLLSQSMTFASTPEGHAYWAEVYERMVHHAEASIGKAEFVEALKRPIKARPQMGAGTLIEDASSTPAQIITAARSRLDAVTKNATKK